MANICSVDFLINFESQERSSVFREAFDAKIKGAGARGEGLRISHDTCLFDATIDDVVGESVSIRGWVNWGLTHEAIREFVEELKKHGLKSLECEYEEAGNLIYGKYEYHNEALWDTYLSDNNSAWDESHWEDDDYYDKLEEALESDGETVQVA